MEMEAKQISFIAEELESYNINLKFCLPSPPPDILVKGCSKELFYIELHAHNGTRIAEVHLLKPDMTRIMICEVKLADMTGMILEKMENLKNAIFFMKLSSDYSHSVLFCKSASASQIEGCAHILGGMGSSFHVKDRTMPISPMIDCRLEADYLIAKHDKDIEIITASTNSDETEFDSTNEVHLLSIPFHILETIMESCFGVEYMNFRATCKRCYLAAPLTRWQTYSPWLMLLDTSRGKITFIDPICGDKYFIETPQELNGSCEILCSRFGWLMINVNDCELLLFNPFTSNICKLPAAPYYFESLCFSAPPTSTECMVVGCASHFVCVHFVSQEASSWHTYRFDIPPYCFRFPAFSGRDIWALCNNDKILTLRDIGEGYSLDVVKHKVPRVRGSHTEYYLSKCGEHLLLIIVNDLGESVEVFKLNESTKEWEKIDDLGKHMIYISEDSCICLEAKASQMGNKIYFPRLLRSKGTKIVFYSLETRKFHTFDDKNVQESFGFDLSVTYWYNLPYTWIEPNCS
ncbi:F-box/kelch-repeat protein At1g57790-like [Bidens hawaiensis]|uniref:F-box/kelch-repeat protein At1g57790-like n=1 Tax=Bidens hawaiensis TaxID=980011 RepID=UPI00404A1214